MEYRWNNNFSGIGATTKPCLETAISILCTLKPMNNCILNLNSEFHSLIYNSTLFSAQTESENVYYTT